ncbi:alpha/beta hydrolase [Actinomadura barringtoniae]|uniref:Alpha/beta hydrolase n=1 Tax=Actinomadura barringtoniae TaxID=1427535 RepID=A0A939PN29_9ACTN|nr:alpha/beta hydrolase [Actinomadura barringtoniae]MBO2455670.1 alpha/beta hydrolase [Actinomadura barringtoniae]
MKTNTLQVPGGELYYEIQGAGPLLLISQSGEGDARRSRHLVDRLIGDYTVITYDRRGLAHSRTDEPATMATHADDVHRLLAALTNEPVAMLGCSMGAAIGLHLAVRHPEQLSTLVAHEPVTPWMLGAAERAHHCRELEECQEVFHRDGWQAALKPMVKTLGINPAAQDLEPGVQLPPITPERAAGFAYFIAHDFTAVREDHLDASALQKSPVRIIPATGRTTPRQVFDHKCAVELAALRGVPLEEFPGGHNGNMTHPTAYADRLRTLLS